MFSLFRSLTDTSKGINFCSYHNRPLFSWSETKSASLRERKSSVRTMDSCDVHGVSYVVEGIASQSATQPKACTPSFIVCHSILHTSCLPVVAWMWISTLTSLVKLVKKIIWRWKSKFLLLDAPTPASLMSTEKDTCHIKSISVEEQKEHRSGDKNQIPRNNVPKYDAKSSTGST